MASIRTASVSRKIDYPVSDGQPVGETPYHRDNILQTVETLQHWYADNSRVYVSGNMFLYYVPGDRLRHLSPDVFVAFGIPKTPERMCYLVWEEGKAPDVVFEITSPSTRAEDLDDKFAIYQDTLKVKEYFLFDPNAEYLRPPLKGFRLQKGKYVPIKPVKGRLFSKVLGLQVARDGWRMRLYDPKSKQWLLWQRERAEAAIAWAEAERAQAEEQRAQAEEQRAQAEEQRAQAKEQRARAKSEWERAESELARAEAERTRAEAERTRAEAEQARAEKAEAALRDANAEMQRLQKELSAARQRKSNHQ